MLAALISLLGTFAAATPAGGATKPTLDIYWIDAEGGASTLVVSPTGQAMLVDSANRKPDDRDAKRIHAVAKLAGLREDRHPADHALPRRPHGRGRGAVEADPHRALHRPRRFGGDRPAQGGRGLQGVRRADRGQAQEPGARRPHPAARASTRWSSPAAPRSIDAPAEGRRPQQAAVQDRRAEAARRGSREQPEPGLRAPLRQVRLPQPGRSALGLRDPAGLSRSTAWARSTSIRPPTTASTARAPRRWSGRPGRGWRS